MEVDKRICCGSILSLVEIFFSLFFLVGGLGVGAGGGGRLYDFVTKEHKI